MTSQHQAAGAAVMLVILAQARCDFRGESRFITWAYRFVILEVSSKLGRHYWRNPLVAPDAGQWEAASPTGSGSIRRGMRSRRPSWREVRRVVDDEELTVHQRRVFVAVVADGIPSTRYTPSWACGVTPFYKVIFDARRKIRRALVANGLDAWEEPGLEQR